MELQSIQQTFLEAYKNKMCNVSQACDAVGICRGTYYNWLKQNQHFKTEIENINEHLIDYAESQLFKNIADGKEASLIFFLKSRAKHRGYVEKQEMEVSAQPTGFKIEKA